MAAKRSFDIGQQIGDLTIVGFDGSNPHNRGLYVCKCKCGREVKKRANQLSENITHSCGCQRTGKWKGVGQVSLTYFYRLKQGAKERGLKFTVTQEFLAKLLEVQQNRCAISGRPIGFDVKTAGRHTASVDRIDSNKGYAPENVWWVHADVNRMKMALPLWDFIDLCEDVTRMSPSLRSSGIKSLMRLDLEPPRAAMTP